MSAIWLVRHGEAEKAPGQSPDDLFSAARDPPLSARGISQAEGARDALASEKVDAVYASPARRAQETARIIAGAHDLVVHLDPRFAELPVGGAGYEETLATILELPSRFRERPDPFGRERADFAAAFQEISRQHAGAIVVAHGLSNRAFLCAHQGIPLDELLTIPMDHAQVTRVGS